MLNQDLIDPKDIQIHKLKNTIEKFKKYDQERKEYYKTSLVRLGELESYVLELEEEINAKTTNALVERLRQKIKRQKAEITRLNSREIPNPSEEYRALQDKMSLIKIENQALQLKVKSYKKTINELIQRLALNETDKPVI